MVHRAFWWRICLSGRIGTMTATRHLRPLRLRLGITAPKDGRKGCEESPLQ